MSIAANRRLPTRPPDVYSHRPGVMRSGVESVSVDWAAAFYAAYSHLLPAMSTRNEVESHFVLWSTNPDFAPSSLFITPRPFRQVLFAMAHELEVCKVSPDGSVCWAYPK
jgi:hypothetical protein